MRLIDENAPDAPHRPPAAGAESFLDTAVAGGLPDLSPPAPAADLPGPDGGGGLPDIPGLPPLGED